MKYLTITKIGRIEIKETERPKPKRNEVIIKTKATGVCKSDVNTFTGAQPIDSDYASHLGHEGAGIVEEVGSEVSRFKPGDKVTSLALSAFAEYCITSEEKVAKIPEDVEEFSFWISEPVACVVNALRSMKLEPGQKLALIGCGFMGLLIMQGLPKEYLESLIAVDIIDSRLKIAGKYGADVLINPQKVDLETEVRKVAPEGVDVVVEAGGGELGLISAATSIVRNRGQISLHAYHPKREVLEPDLWHMKGLDIINSVPNHSRDFIKDFRDAVALLKKRRFRQDELITHKCHYTEAQKLFETASKKADGYIKGTILF